MNTDDDTNIRTIYKCFKLHARCKHNMHAFRFYLCNWISGNIRIKHLYTTHAVYQKVRRCWHCTRSVEWLSELVLRMKLDFCQSLPLCLCKLLSADKRLLLPFPHRSLPCQLSIMTAGERWNVISMSISKATRLQPCRRRKLNRCFVEVVFFFGFSFVFEDQMIWDMTKDWRARLRLRCFCDVFFFD